MATSFTNAWKENVEEIIQDAVRSEFSNGLPIFRTPNFKFRGNNFMTIKGINSSSDNSMYAVIPNKFFVQLDYYHYDNKRNDTTVKRFFSQISRIEELFYSILEARDLYDMIITSITYQDAEEMQGFRKAVFNIEVSNVR